MCIGHTPKLPHNDPHNFLFALFLSVIFCFLNPPAGERTVPLDCRLIITAADLAPLFGVFKAVEIILPSILIHVNRESCKTSTVYWHFVQEVVLPYVCQKVFRFLVLHYNDEWVQWKYCFKICFSAKLSTYFKNFETGGFEFQILWILYLFSKMFSNLQIFELI